MNFVLLNQFYPPDVLPTGVVLEAVAEALVSKGHQVTVVCGQSVAGSSGLAVGSRREDAGYGQKAGDKSSIDSRHSSVNSKPRGHVRVVRLWAPGWGKRKSAVGKILSYAAYYGGVAAWLLRRRVRADVVVALTSPPYLSLLARAGAWWHGGHHAHWIMDLYPDVMVAHGMLNERSLGHGVLGALARWGMGGPRCREVITLGPDMAERLNPWLPANQPAVWVPLWGTAGDPPAPQEVTALRQQRGWSPETTVFLYSGNMGLGHRFTEVLEAMPQLAAAHPDQSIHLAYFGGGKRHSEIAAALSALVPSPSSSLPSGLRSQPSGLPHLPPPTANRQPPTQAPLPLRSQVSALSPSPSPAPQVSGLRSQPFSVSGYVPKDELSAHLASGDVHLASLEPAWDGMMVPSKLQGIFAAGRPVLFTGSRTCSIGRWILESGAGWVCEPGDVEAHLAAMTEALDPDQRARRGHAAEAFAAEHFSQEKNVNRIVALLEDLGPEGGEGMGKT